MSHFSLFVFIFAAGPAGWVDRFAGKPRKGCDILVQALEREGVETGRVSTWQRRGCAGVGVGKQQQHQQAQGLRPPGAGFGAQGCGDRCDAGGGD